MSRRFGERAFFAAALYGLLGSLGCSDDVSHVFGAYRYEAGPDCLEPAAAVDVIAGADPGPCSAIRCWISPAEDVYVTTTACDAPPDYTEHTSDPANSACGHALAAFNRTTDHSPCPIPPDAGD